MIRQILSVLVILAAANPLVLSGMLGARQAVNFVTLLTLAAFLLVNIRPIRSAGRPAVCGSWKPAVRCWGSFWYLPQSA